MLRLSYIALNFSPRHLSTLRCVGKFVTNAAPIGPKGSL